MIGEQKRKYLHNKWHWQSALMVNFTAQIYLCRIKTKLLALQSWCSGCTWWTRDIYTAIVCVPSGSIMPHIPIILMMEDRPKKWSSTTSCSWELNFDPSLLTLLLLDEEGIKGSHLYNLLLPIETMMTVYNHHWQQKIEWNIQSHLSA